MPATSQEAFQVQRDSLTLHGDSIGDGPAIVMAHGLTATRRYVVHGSKKLPREGFRVVSYDARAHGESDPAPEGQGYTYSELADDLRLVIEAEVGEGSPVLAGHSMGAHTIAALALAEPTRFAGLVLIGPVVTGVPYDDAVLAEWDELAEGLERAGVEGFLEVYGSRDLDPAWRDVLLRIARERLSQHRHPKALARALREVPRSLPFGGLGELEALEVPALIVASHDEADPGHPFTIAQAWADALPNARLVSEEQGESPLAWQGGRLSREIAKFCEEPAVAEALASNR